MPPKLLVFAAMNAPQLYRMRAPASGREAIAPAEPGQIYVDRETGEEMEPVAMVLPLAPSASSLPRTPGEPAGLPPLRPADRPRRQRLPVLRAPPERSLRRRAPPTAVASRPSC